VYFIPKLPIIRSQIRSSRDYRRETTIFCRLTRECRPIVIAAEIFVVVVSLTISMPRELIGWLIIIITPARKTLNDPLLRRRRSRQRDRVNCKNRWSIVRQSRERRVRFALPRGYSSFNAGRATRLPLARTKNSSAQRAPSRREKLCYRFLLSRCLIVPPCQSFWIRASSTRSTSSRTKPREEYPLWSSFALLPVRYSLFVRSATLGLVSESASCNRHRSVNACFISIQIEPASSSIASDQQCDLDSNNLCAP